MSKAFFVLGDYDELTMNMLLSYTDYDIYCCLFYNKPITFKNPRIKITYNKVSCPDNILTASAEDMRNWIYQECFDRCKELTDGKEYAQVIVTSFGYYVNPNDLYDCSGLLVSNAISLNLECDYFISEPFSQIQPNILFDNVSYCGTNPFLNVDTNENTKIFLIPSVIRVEKDNRSVFSTEERMIQTCRQLDSIHRYYPDAITVLLEMSNLTNEELSQLSKKATKIVLYTNNEELQFHAHRNENKNATEVYALADILGKLPSEYSHICKFGGRYWFAGNSNLFENMPVMKRLYANCYDQQIVEPVFYSIPKKLVEKYRESLGRMKERLRREFTDVERMLWDEFGNRVAIVVPESMNIMGYTATSGIFRYF